MTKKEYDFLHPSHGRCKRNNTKAAIRWVDHVAREAQARLLESLGLSLIQPPKPENIQRGRRNVVEINNTTGISWVESKGERLSDQVLDGLDRSDLGQGVSPAYHQEKAPEFEGLFAINPKRLYLTGAAANLLVDLTKMEGL